EGGSGPPSAPEPHAAQHRRGAALLPQGAGARDEPRSTRPAATGSVSGRRRRIQPGPRPAVQRPADGGRHQRDTGGGAMTEIPLKAKDFKSDQEVRWCPGCGDYAILAAVQSFLPELGRTPDDIVFVSGIGCSSRFPYYLSTYGLHSIHGRAPAIATGLSV